IAAPVFEDEIGVHHKFDGYTTGNTDAVQTMKQQMESKNNSRARFVQILNWTMIVVACLAVLLSILGWICVYLLTVRISNNAFDIVRVEQACAEHPLPFFPETTSSNSNCRSAGEPLSDVPWENVKGKNVRYRKLSPGVLYRREAGENVIEQT
ncbi:hypothetical protein PFISCL1PPCAC_16076, partial [Pristionchus fissidentatus]